MRLVPAASPSVSIVQGGNAAAVSAAPAILDETLAQYLNVVCATYGFNGVDLVRLLAVGDDSDGVPAQGTGVLITAARLLGFNGTTFDRIRSEGTDRDAIAVATLGRLETLGYPHLFNGTTWDRQRALGSTVLNGLGQASVSLAVPGAGTVGTLFATLANTTARTLFLSPGPGLRIRVLSVAIASRSTSPTRCEVYFGTGADITVSPGQAVAGPILDTDIVPSFYNPFADGSGPVGLVDAVLSIRRDAGGVNNIEFIISTRIE